MDPMGYSSPMVPLLCYRFSSDKNAEVRKKITPIKRAPGCLGCHVPLMGIPFSAHGMYIILFFYWNPLMTSLLIGISALLWETFKNGGHLGSEGSQLVDQFFGSIPNLFLPMA